MRRKKVDSSLERLFLIGLITSKPFLAGAAPLLKLDLLPAAHFKTLTQWCLSYFRQYKEAPGRNIEALYHAWQEKEGAEQEEQADAIEDLLGSLSEEYDKGSELNVPYMLDKLGQYLTFQSLQQTADKLTSSLSNGNTDEAFQAITDARKVDPNSSTGFDPFTDRAAWKRAFAEPSEPLFTLPGDAGDFFRAALCRDGLVGIQAPEKSGKTWLCIELLMRALQERRKVAFFQVGDLTEGQVLRRLGVRLSSRPQFPWQCNKPIPWPKRIDIDKDDGKWKASAAYVPKHCSKPISYQSCVRSCRKFLRGCGIRKLNSHLMVSVHANSTINVEGLDGILERWEQERGFTADVVIVDYADILAPEDTRKEPRHQVNDTWKALRRMSQERHCLVIAPSQANAASYNAKVQTKSNFSEDKRKNAHVTAMLGLNQTDSEKEQGIMRLNWTALREAEFVASRVLYVGQCLTLGRFMTCSTFG